MLERFLVEGTPRRKIAVETHRGTPVENFIAPAPSQFDVNCYHGVIRRSHPNWIPRKDATGIYNCAGMVWASRRASLPKPSDWEVILKEDGYRQLETASEAMIGDVVIYRNKEDGEILHVAKLCGIERLSASGEALGDPILKALSKWDSRCGEDIHRLDDVNLVAGTPFDIELWTDRQSEPDPRLRHIQNLPLVTS